MAGDVGRDPPRLPHLADQGVRKRRHAGGLSADAGLGAHAGLGRRGGPAARADHPADRAGRRLRLGRPDGRRVRPAAGAPGAVLVAADRRLHRPLHGGRRARRARRAVRAQLHRLDIPDRRRPDRGDVRALARAALHPGRAQRVAGGPDRRVALGGFLRDGALGAAARRHPAPGGAARDLGAVRRRDRHRLPEGTRHRRPSGQRRPDRRRRRGAGVSLRFTGEELPSLTAGSGRRRSPTPGRSRSATRPRPARAPRLRCLSARP
jgi:hypothetical protein